MAYSSIHFIVGEKALDMLDLKKTSTNNLKSQVTSAAAFCLFFVMIFWVLPIDILRANEEAFSSPALLAPFALIVLLSFTFGLLLFRKSTTGSTAILALSYLGLFATAFYSINSGGLVDGPAETTVSGPLISTLLLNSFGIVVVIGLLRCAVTRKVLVNLTALCAVSLFSISSVLLIVRFIASSGPSLNPDRNSAFNHNAPNVYHFLLDGFSSDLFLPTLVRTNGRNAFAGFTYFSNILSNYTRTQESLPSLLTGTLANTQAMKDWSLSFNTQGIFPAARKLGYRILAYGSETRLLFQGADQKTTFASIRKKIPAPALGAFLDAWVARIGFPFISRSFVRNGIGPISRWQVGEGKVYFISTTSSISRLVFEKALADEPARASTGQYVYIHLLLPHSPFNLDNNCNFLPGGTNYEDQTACVVFLVTRYLELLKSLGRFDSSIILIHSDHGEYFPRPSYTPQMSPEQSEQIQSQNLYGFSGMDLERRTRALLAIKPAHSKATNVEVSDKSGDLLDLSATLYPLLGATEEKSEGHDLFSKGSKDRIINIFDGFVIRGQENQSILRFGEQFYQGEINNYQVSPEGWTETSRLPIKW